MMTAEAPSVGTSPIYFLSSVPPPATDGRSRDLVIGNIGEGLTLQEMHEFLDRTGYSPERR